jgi:hypothetical protein
MLHAKPFPELKTQGSGLGLRRLGFEGGNVLGQEIVQHGADRGDHGQFPDVLPGGRDGRAQDIGGQREFEGQQNPGGELQPNFAAAELVGGPGEDGSEDTPKRLNAADDHDDDGAHLDDEGDIAGDDVEELLERNDPVPLSAALRLSRFGTGRNCKGSASCRLGDRTQSIVLPSKWEEA